MSRSTISRFRYGLAALKAAATAGAALAAWSCGLVDLRPVGLSLFPDTAGTVLESRDAVLRVGFSSAPVRLEAERAFSVASPEGAVQGDFLWDGNGFSWRPLEPWDPAVRYRLRLSGELGMEDGRRLRPEAELPFYAVKDGARPFLESVEPADGASAGVAMKGEAALTLRFSARMDGDTLREALSLRPSLEYDAAWDEAGRVVRLLAREATQACSPYAWDLSTALRDADGAPLARAERGCFSTDADSVAPYVERAYPAAWLGGRWVEAGDSLARLDRGQAVAVRFSEPMDGPSVRAGVRIEKGPPGRVEMASALEAVYRPDGDWVPEAPLRLVVSRSVKDRSGLGMAEDYREAFVPSVPWLGLLAAEGGEGESLLAGGGAGSGGPIACAAGEAPEGLFTVNLTFSAPFDLEGRLSVVELARLSAFFPSYAPSPRLRSATWFSSDTLSLTWEGLRRSDGSIEYYYELRLRGGPSGARSAEGLVLKEDIVKLIRTKP